ncbi:V-type ATP synthase subunit D [Breznakiella homolactica]|uniref:V-type ATP synthase subunit D n=1 Tax=Breznakiella homolactica TaxID=2798577 RepID=A0A7T7XKR5_9SPIR|nr:V-type ATP synthase subunit D [Breznakiella homolactica]QQO08220.1 V-type ATP synthase subunit D [Breznakiella homolactica]
MAKIKLTKNELKKQKDELKMYQRYLPTLMLKKQQLQAEIRTIELRIKELMQEKDRVDEGFKSWIGVFGETGVFTPDMLRITELRAGRGNIAGVEIPVFEGADFELASYDLARIPLWVDTAIDRMKQVLLLDLEAQTLEEQRKRLDHELRITTQRVNLFEKIKIPETKGNIKKIQVYLGDQQTSAVVRGKIAKRGMERAAQ